MYGNRFAAGFDFDGVHVYLGVFLMRQFMLAIPDSICESAKIDGAGHFQIYTRIIVPLMKPAMATLGILKAVWSWNDYQGPLVFINSSEKFTVQLAVQQFAQSDGLTPHVFACNGSFSVWCRTGNCGGWNG